MRVTRYDPLAMSVHASVSPLSVRKELGERVDMFVAVPDLQMQPRIALVTGVVEQVVVRVEHALLKKLRFVLLEVDERVLDPGVIGVVAQGLLKKDRREDAEVMPETWCEPVVDPKRVELADLRRLPRSLVDCALDPFITELGVSFAGDCDMNSATDTNKKVLGVFAESNHVSICTELSALFCDKARASILEIKVKSFLSKSFFSRFFFPSIDGLIL